MDKNRFIEVDLWRGLVVMGMIVFHAFVVLDYFDVLRNDMFAGWWEVLGSFIRLSFLLIVGVSIVLFYKKTFSWKVFYLKQLERAFWVFLMGMIVTLVTYLFIPDYYVRFGILHLIGVGIFFVSFVVVSKYLALILGISMIWLGFWLKNFTTTSIPLFILGLRGEGISSVDHFPLFPWLGVVALGVFLGHLLYKKYRPLLEMKSNFLSGIAFLGRHSLIIYMLHVPVIILIFVFVGFLSINDIL